MIIVLFVRTKMW